MNIKIATMISLITFCTYVYSEDTSQNEELLKSLELCLTKMMNTVSTPESRQGSALLFTESLSLQQKNELIPVLLAMVIRERNAHTQDVSALTVALHERDTIIARLLVNLKTNNKTETDNAIPETGQPEWDMVYTVVRTGQALPHHARQNTIHPQHNQGPVKLPPRPTGANRVN